jgi:carboxypeptidase C (cathepsin A)
MFTASLNAPSTDPVVSWYNGGPGCSSMEGGMSESGLYRIDQFSDPPTVTQNPWSWCV